MPAQAGDSSQENVEEILKRISSHKGAPPPLLSLHPPTLTGPSAHPLPPRFPGALPHPPPPRPLHPWRTTVLKLHLWPPGRRADGR